MTSLTWDRHKGHAWSYDVLDLGYNYRFDEIRSAIGRVQLRKLERNNNLRQDRTALYHELLQEMVPAVCAPFREHPGVSACHLLPILLPKGVARAKFMEGMKARGIQTSIHYPPIHQFTAYAGSPRPSASDLSRTENLAGREVTLPLYPRLSAEEVMLVVKSVKDALDAGRGA